MSYRTDSFRIRQMTMVLLADGTEAGDEFMSSPDPRLNPTIRRVGRGICVCGHDHRDQCAHCEKLGEFCEKYRRQR